MWTDTPEHHYAACQNSLHRATSTTNPGSFNGQKDSKVKKKKQVEQRTAFVMAPDGGGGVPA